MDKLEIKYVNTKDVKPYNRNARFNDTTVEKLCKAIKEVGFNVPIVVDKNNVIIKGHARWKAAIKMGLEQVPVIVSENSDEVNKIDRLLDNKLSEFSQWDDNLLNVELNSIDFNFQDFGFDGIDFVKKSNSSNDEEKSYKDIDTSEFISNYDKLMKEVAESEEKGEAFITADDVKKTVGIDEKKYRLVKCPHCGKDVIIDD